jgi:hypothetical protein
VLVLVGEVVVDAMVLDIFVLSLPRGGGQHQRNKD